MRDRYVKRQTCQKRHKITVLVELVAPQKENSTAQVIIITVTSRDHALNNAVKSSKKHSSLAQSSPVQIKSLSFKAK